ncbi:hypothetical protein H4R19_000724 [Coemansia spiralis]|nr:hypothetical protein H4R19_000724 [Coemansia spiralis]
MPEQPGRPASSGESSLASESFGERFIKTTDDTRINPAMGVGRCALHPCLTRRATVSVDGSGPPAAAAKELDGTRPGLAAPEPLSPPAMALSQAAAATAAAVALAEGMAACNIRRTPGAEQPGGSSSGTATGGASARQTPSAASGASAATQGPRRLPSDSGLQLELKRKELARAGKRHSEAAAQAVRTMERGLRSGADTPTVDLVQTAVSVREVSKLIGRTVVQMSNVRRIMIVTKPNDTSLVSLTRDLAMWLVERPAEDGAPPMVVYVEEFIAQHRNFNLARMAQRHPALAQSLQFWTPELCARCPEIFDFVVTLGGDGTVLYTSWLFQTTVPPIIPFHLGSLGFLTVFDHRHARRVLDSAIHAGMRINLRMRFTCTVYRLAEEVDPAHANVLVDAADRNRRINRKIATHGLQSDAEPLCSGDEDGSATPEASQLAAAVASAAASAGMPRPKPPARSLTGSLAGAPRRRAGSGAPSSSSSSSASDGVPAAGAAMATQSTRHSTSRTHARRCSEACRSDADAGSADGEDHPRTGPRRTPSTGAAPRPLRKRSSNASTTSRAAAAATAATSTTASQPPSSSGSRRSVAPVAVLPAVQASSDSDSDGCLGTENGNKDPAPAAAAAAQAAAGRQHGESEWDDVPRAYQRRVRRVWKRDSTFQVLNEVVVDRGPSPYLSQIELYGDGAHLTTVEADGLCLATPTGSTAYSLAAGGSLVHPEIPAVLVTPICPHTLSFRPMLLPDSMVLRVVLPPDSRNTAWASFDGRHRIELGRGDHIQITASKYPLPTVCASQSQTQDWMASLSRCLNWNERKRQKKFDPVTRPGPESEHSEDGGNVGDDGSGLDDDQSPGDILSG